MLQYLLISFFILMTNCTYAHSLDEKLQKLHEEKNALEKKSWHSFLSRENLASQLSRESITKKITRKNIKRVGLGAGICYLNYQWRHISHKNIQYDARTSEPYVDLKSVDPDAKDFTKNACISLVTPVIDIFACYVIISSAYTKTKELYNEQTALNAKLAQLNVEIAATEKQEKQRQKLVALQKKRAKEKEGHDEKTC